MKRLGIDSTYEGFRKDHLKQIKVELDPSDAEFHKARFLVEIQSYSMFIGRKWGLAVTKEYADHRKETRKLKAEFLLKQTENEIEECGGELDQLRDSLAHKIIHSLGNQGAPSGSPNSTTEPTSKIKDQERRLQRLEKKLETIESAYENDPLREINYLGIVEGPDEITIRSKPQKWYGWVGIVAFFFSTTVVVFAEIKSTRRNTKTSS